MIVALFYEATALYKNSSFFRPLHRHNGFPKRSLLSFRQLAELQRSRQDLLYLVMAATQIFFHAL
jgi:hypothetical protein